MQWLYDFTYLAKSQFITLWFNKSDKTLYRLLKSLRERNLIKTTCYKYSPKDWRLEDIHFLSIKWYKYILDHLGLNRWFMKVKLHKGFYQDYDHRKKTIDCKIVFIENLKNYNVDLITYNQYFESTKWKNKYRHMSTKIVTNDLVMIPDSVIKIESWKVQHLYCLEYHKWYRVKKIEKQMKQYVQAISAWTPSYTFNVDTNAKVLLVFECQSTLETMQERISKNDYYQNFAKIFLFKTYDDFMKNPFEHRKSLANQKLNIWEFSNKSHQIN